MSDQPGTTPRRRPTRFALGVLGVAAVAVAAVALLRATGVFGTARDAIAGPSLTSDIIESRDAILWTTLAVATAVALLSLWWLVSLLRPSRPPRRDLVLHSAEGRSWQAVVRNAAIEDAVVAELTNDGDVHGASARLVAPTPERAMLLVAVYTEGDADLGRIERQLRHGVLGRVWPVPPEHPGWPVLVADVDALRRRVD